MNCLECGADSDGTTSACTWCGAPITDKPAGVADPAAEAVQIICPECGAESPEVTEVCARCWAPVAYQPSVAGDHAVGQRVSPGRSEPSVVGIVKALLTGIAVIVGLAAIALLVWGLGWTGSG
jgi:ribosomal protein L37E